MSLRKLGTAAVVAMTLAGTMAMTVQPASAWCGRWGRCGWGWRGGGWGPGAVAAGVLAGAAVGTAAAVAAGPGPYRGGPGPYYGRPGGYYACPPGYHWGQGGQACFAN